MNKIPIFAKNMEEKDLILGLKTGEEDAYSRIYSLYWRKVYNFARLYITSGQEIEDIVQEVFIKLWDSRHLIDENKSFVGYLFVITRNAVFNRSRKHLNYSFLKQTILQSIEQHSYEDDSSLELADLKKHISVLISQLPPRQQEVFLMSREKHMSYAQIAQELSISEKTVEYHISAALKYLRKNLYLLALFLGI